MITNPKLYPLFAQKINNKLKSQFLEVFDIKTEKDQKYKTIISFQNTKQRELFISKHKNLKIIKSIDIIPSIAVSLNEIQIQEIKSDDLVIKIEEDQKLYLSMLDVIEIIGLSSYRKAKIPYTGNNVVIGVIDDGINPEFDPLANIIMNKYQQSNGEAKINNKNTNDKVSHGTLMANLIGNQFLDDNEIVIGIAPNAKIYDFDISNIKEEYYFSNILEVFDFILKNGIKLDIILIPLTTLESSDGNDILSIACNLLVDKDFIILCPAGNFGPESYTIGSPAAAQKVLTIGSLTKEMTIAYYSGRGPTLDNRLKPNICLPGSKIEIPISNKRRIRFSGTSVSAALASGLVALLKEYTPNISYKELMNLFHNVSIDLNYENISQGYGTVNIMEIFRRLGYYQQAIRIIPYKDLIKKSLKASIEIITFLIIIYLIVYFFNLIYLIYNIF
ncbi:MAG: S8 family serine peptidase [Promethearchaeota archaeon]